MKNITFDEFAFVHGLEMEVRYYHPDRFVAHFKGVEIKEDDGCLLSAYGDGNTWRKAIKDYRLRLKGVRLVIDAFKPTRREIDTPKCWARP